MWNWETVVGIALVLVGLGIMAGQNFDVNAYSLLFFGVGAVLILVRAMHREPKSVDWEGANRARMQRLAEELSKLRTYGLHHIRNEFEANPGKLQTYLDREREWAGQIRELMQRYECPTTDISRVMDITNSEIGMAAAGATYGPEGNWLIGVVEMRVRRLAALIAKYEA